MIKREHLENACAQVLSLGLEVELLQVFRHVSLDHIGKKSVRPLI